jgi:hypothetical protein
LRLGVWVLIRVTWLASGHTEVIHDHATRSYESG